jgi:hypothetical protein
VLRRLNRRWERVGNVERIGMKRNLYKISIRKPQSKSLLWRHTRRQENNIKMDLGGIWCDGVDGTPLVRILPPSIFIENRKFTDHLKNYTFFKKHPLHTKRDLGFSRRRVWRWMSSGLLCRVVWQNFTDVSDVLAASIIRTTHLPDYTEQQPRRQPSSSIPYCLQNTEWWVLLMD